MPKTEAISEQNVTEVPLYTSLDAARYLRVPAWVPLVLSENHRLHPEEVIELFWRRDHDLAEFEDDYGVAIRGNRPRRISFRLLATLFVHSPFFRALPFWLGPFWRPHHAVESIEIAFDYLRAISSQPNQWSNMDPMLSRLKPWVKDLDEGRLRKSILLHLARVEMSKGTPTRLFPFSRDPTPDAPATVVIDPEIRFGRPSVKGVPTDVIVDRWRAGDTSANLADDYGLTTDEVDEAIRYESAPYPFPAFPAFDW